jgi:hypothetical protein
MPKQSQTKKAVRKRRSGFITEDDDENNFLSRKNRKYKLTKKDKEKLKEEIEQTKPFTIDPERVEVTPPPSNSSGAAQSQQTILSDGGIIRDQSYEQRRKRYLELIGALKNDLQVFYFESIANGFPDGSVTSIPTEVQEKERCSDCNSKLESKIIRAFFTYSKSISVECIHILYLPLYKTILM